MSIQQLEAFHRYAVDLVRRTDPPPSIEECLRRWRQAAESEETVAAVHRSLEDIQAGRTRTLERVDEEIRTQMGFGPREP